MKIEGENNMVLANNIKADIQNTFGQVAQPVEHPTQREEIMSFSKSGVRVNFNLNGYWDEAKGEYREPVPAISLSYNKKYCSLPTEADMLIELGKFLTKVGEACKGLPERDFTVVHDDLDAAKKILQKYKAA